MIASIKSATMALVMPWIVSKLFGINMTQSPMFDLGTMIPHVYF